MSHVAMAETKPGEPMFASIEALHLAAAMCKGRIVERNTYHWWLSHVGDYPLPKGVKKEDLGKNAVFVFEIDPANYAELGIGTKDYDKKPYDIGFVEDPNNPGCYVPIYDFYAGGYGLEAAVGKPLFINNDQKNIKMLCPKLKQNYDMACDALAAKSVGDKIEFLTAKAAHNKYPQLFPEKTEDEQTWVSIVDTSNRINASLS